MRRINKNTYRKYIVGLMMTLALVPATSAKGEAASPTDMDQRIAAISYRLAKGAEPYCTVREHLTGTSVHEPAAYAARERDAMMKNAQLGWGFTVLATVAGGPGERAGLQPGDEITAVNDVQLETFARRLVKRKATYDRVEAFNDMLSSKLAAGPTNLVVRRGQSTITIVLRGETGCGGEATVEDSKSFNAWSDGRYVAVSSELMNATPDDEELAFVLGHEMAHNILGHNAPKKRKSSLFGPKGPVKASAKSKELQADALSIRIMAAAGFDTDASLRFLDHSRKYHSMNLSPTHPGYANRRRGITSAIATNTVEDRIPLPSGTPRGAFADIRNVAAGSQFTLPDAISNNVAAAALVQGYTAEFLMERCAKVEAGQALLVHAAAGGVGLLRVQRLKAIGATVIGTVSSEDKAALAREAGADHILFYTREDTASRVRELTGSAGARMVLDGVGLDTWETSFDSTRRRGLIVSYADASTPATGVNLGILAAKGSLNNTRLTLVDYYATLAEREASAARLWDMVSSRKVKVTVGETYPPEQSEQAHRDLESLATIGSTLLLP